MLKFIFSWKGLRVAILLIILAIVYQQTTLQKRLTQSWNTPLEVMIFPINADGSTASETYLQSLDTEKLTDMQKFMSKQSQVHGLWTDKPVNFHLDKSVIDLPPTRPDGSSLFQNIAWSLKFRNWSRKHKKKQAKISQIKIYFLLHDPATHPRLPHSAGLQKGLIGVVYAYADKQYAIQNNIITVHELLHTLGATDKYNLATGEPIFPDGYANPVKTPLLPQRNTEIMGGRRAISATKSEMPRSFSKVVIGKKTATEIGWLKE